MKGFDVNRTGGGSSIGGSLWALRGALQPNNNRPIIRAFFNINRNHGHRKSLAPPPLVRVFDPPPQFSIAPYEILIDVP